MGASKEVSSEEYVAVAKLYRTLLSNYWRKFPGAQKHMDEADANFSSILASPDALRLKASCYLLYRDLREELSDLHPSVHPEINEQIKQALGQDTRYTIGRQS